LPHQDLVLPKKLEEPLSGEVAPTGRRTLSCQGKTTDTPTLSSLYTEEQVADLVDYFGVSARLSTRKALIGGEHKIRGIFEVERGVMATWDIRSHN
jgi:hypothetical protein